MNLSFHSKTADAAKMELNDTMPAVRVAVNRNYKDLKQKFFVNDMKRILKLCHGPTAFLYKTISLFLNVATCLFKEGQIGTSLNAKQLLWKSISLKIRIHGKMHEFDHYTSFLSRPLAFFPLNSALYLPILGLHLKTFSFLVLLAFRDVLCTLKPFILQNCAMLVIQEPLFFELHLLNFARLPPCDTLHHESGNIFQHARQRALRILSGCIVVHETFGVGTAAFARDDELEDRGPRRRELLLGLRLLVALRPRVPLELVLLENRSSRRISRSNTVSMLPNEVPISRTALRWLCLTSNLASHVQQTPSQGLT